MWFRTSAVLHGCAAVGTPCTEAWVGVYVDVVGTGCLQKTHPLQLVCVVSPCFCVVTASLASPRRLC